MGAALEWHGSGLISVAAAQHALAATFLEPSSLGPPPTLHELLADARWQEALQPSRLLARA